MANVNNLNVVAISGRLTKDCECRYNKSGDATVTFTLAVNSSKRSNNGYESYANYFFVKFFGKAADNLSKYLNKGQQVNVTGSLSQERWGDNNDKKSRVVILASKCELVGGQPKNDNSNNQPQQNSYQQPKQSSQNYNQSENEDFADDIPF